MPAPPEAQLPLDFKSQLAEAPSFAPADSSWHGNVSQPIAIANDEQPNPPCMTGEARRSHGCGGRRASACSDGSDGASRVAKRQLMWNESNDNGVEVPRPRIKPFAACSSSSHAYSRKESPVHLQQTVAHVAQCIYMRSNHNVDEAETVYRCSASAHGPWPSSAGASTQRLPPPTPTRSYTNGEYYQIDTVAPTEHGSRNAALRAWQPSPIRLVGSVAEDAAILGRLRLSRTFQGAFDAEPQHQRQHPHQYLRRQHSRQQHLLALPYPLAHSTPPPLLRREQWPERPAETSQPAPPLAPHPPPWRPLPVRRRWVPRRYSRLANLHAGQEHLPAPRRQQHPQAARPSCSAADAGYRQPAGAPQPLPHCRRGVLAFQPAAPAVAAAPAQWPVSGARATPVARNSSSGDAGWGSGSPPYQRIAWPAPRFGPAAADVAKPRLTPPGPTATCASTSIRVGGAGVGAAAAAIPFDAPGPAFLRSPPPPPGDPARLHILYTARSLRLSPPTTARLAIHIWDRVQSVVQLRISFAAMPSSPLEAPAATTIRPSAAAAAAMERVYATAALWLAAKLEEPRERQPSVCTLCAAAAAVAAAAAAGGGGVYGMGAVLPARYYAEAELRVLQWCGWSPYAGYEL